MNDQPLGPIAIFAVVFFLLTLLSGAGILASIGATVVACVIFYFVSRWLVARRAGKGRDV